jgi:aminoglycoside 3-N-acetyltransferase
MQQYTADVLAEDLGKISIAGKVAGVHSRLSSIGPIAPSPLSDAEEKKGMKPFAKTVINAFLLALGEKGTLFVPTHSNNTAAAVRSTNIKVENGKIIDDGYYQPHISPSNVGLFTQSILYDDRSLRSLHPTHSTAAIGPEAEYLVKDHAPHTQPVGIENAFAKAIGLDGIIMFIGDVLKANTTFHAYETLLLPDLAPYFPGAAAVKDQGLKRLIRLTWCPHLHRDFYAEGKRQTRSFTGMREAGLLHQAKLGNANLYYFYAKETARFFAETVFPEEPDILFCSKPAPSEICDCAYSVAVMKKFYADENGKWDSEKIKQGMSKPFLGLCEPGIQRI